MPRGPQKPEHKLSVALPSLVGEYDEQRTGKPVDEVSAWSRTPVWWRCAKGHSFLRQPIHRHRLLVEVYGCPECRLSEFNVGLFPGLVAEYDHGKNPLPPAQVLAGSSTLLWWVCAAGHEFQRSPSQRLRSDRTVRPCQLCHQHAYSLATRFPGLAAEFDVDRNGTTPEQVSSSSPSDVWWHCSSGHSFFTSPADRTSGGSPKGCPPCALARNNLVVKLPVLADQFDPERNGVTADQVLHGSNFPYWWRCAEGHSFSASPAQRRDGRTGELTECPECRHARQNLATRFPALASEFDTERNGLHPREVLAKSSNQYWWRCARSHSFQASPAKRSSSVVNDFVSCRICYLEDNCVAALSPEVAAEFDLERNGSTPDQVLAMSNRRLHWICAANSSHRWVATPAGRISGGNGCPACRLAQTSREEIRLACELATAVVFDVQDHRLQGASGKKWSCDIVLRSLKVVVEYDGEYFHSREVSLERDRRKTLDLEAAGWKVVRIRTIALERVNDLDLVAVQDGDAPALTRRLLAHLQGHGLLGEVEYVPGAGAAAAAAYLASTLSTPPDPAPAE